jgi:ABC-type transport system involved in multi-copper enzyme maturation permease subunit
MTWQDIARADIEDGVRSRGLWAVVVVFVVLMVVIGRFVSRAGLPVGALFDTNARTFAFLLTLLFVPVVGLLVGHRALLRAHERNRPPREQSDDAGTPGDDADNETSTVDAESDGPDTAGTDAESDGPDTGGTDAESDEPDTTGETGGTTGGTETSQDLFLGTVVGRTVVLAVAIFAGFLPTFVVWVAQSGVASLYEVLVAFLVAVVYGLLFVGVGIAISTLTTNRARAAAGAAGAFVGLYAWPFLPGLAGIDVPYALLDLFWLVFLVGDLSTTLFSLRQGEPTSAILGVVVLGLFVAAPLTLGYVRFNRDGVPG